MARPLQFCTKHATLLDDISERETTAMRNGHYILDAHCHIYPEKLAARAGAHISAFYGGLPVCGGSVSLLLPLMQQQGIDFALVNSAAMTPHQVDSVNRFVLETVHVFPNFFVDCSSSFDVLTPAQAMHCIRTYGADRVMFGTDHPIFRPGTDLRYLESLPLSDAQQEAILWKNACRIYRVAPPWCTIPVQTSV